MKHSNISIFVPHIGCPNMCSFCNQHIISGAESAPTADDVRKICHQVLEEIKNPENTEIAFFGGSFTAIPRSYMTELLTAARDFLGEGKFRGIRISTRPDFIDDEILKLLKDFGVTSIELGVQSMSDKVLEANDRGHTAEDVSSASRLIRKYGFELGLQMMVGLYKSTCDDERLTMEKILELHPDTVRIYPVVILEGTCLAELYKSGEYEPMSFERAVEMCAHMLCEFEESGIAVIKCGLHVSEFVEADMVGGYYHQAFRELCEGLIYRKRMEREISEAQAENACGGCVFSVNPRCISKALGHRKSNVEYFKNKGINIKVIGNESIPKYQCKLRK
ncbi:MAG: radical SAM protein [Ruminococcus sp.]|nr:radical SAM protein [Ruminococcus sp.]